MIIYRYQLLFKCLLLWLVCSFTILSNYLKHGKNISIRNPFSDTGFASLVILDHLLNHCKYIISLGFFAINDIHFRNISLINNLLLQYAGAKCSLAFFT